MGRKRNWKRTFSGRYGNVFNDNRTSKVHSLKQNFWIVSQLIFSTKILNFSHPAQQKIVWGDDFWFFHRNNKKMVSKSKNKNYKKNIKMNNFS